MQITHISNSFISVKINKSIIACDPWVGTTEDNAWLAYPFYKNGKNILNNIKPDFIYISHLHGDHFDPGTLLKYKKKETKIIIKKFPNSRLKNKIKKIGFKNILECIEWKKISLNKDISICIVPQMSSNTNQIEEQISYDLDTSILIQSNITKEVFFNNVDNPLSTNDLKIVKKKTQTILKSGIDAVCFPIGSASEYPHCFINVNKVNEKNKIINDSLKKIKSKLRIIKPKAFFSAGGRYIIYGKFSNLNKFVAQPYFTKIKNYLKDENYDAFNIEGGYKICRETNKLNYSRSKDFNKFVFDENKIIKSFKTKGYFYSKKFKNIKVKDIDQAYNKSIVNYKNTLKKFSIKTNWSIDFFIYKNLTINPNGHIKKNKSKFIRKYKLNNNKNSKSKYTKLICHLDYNLFYGLLKRKYVWNTALSGSVVMFKRKPNFFDPNLTFSINFLGC